MMICPKCGNCNKFSQVAYGTVDYTELCLYDKEGKFIETIDTEYGDYHTEEYEKFQCQECDSDILELETQEYIEFISRHTLLDGEWSEDELEKPNMEIKRQLQAKLILGEKI